MSRSKTPRPSSEKLSDDQKALSNSANRNQEQIPINARQQVGAGSRRKGTTRSVHFVDRPLRAGTAALFVLALFAAYSPAAGSAQSTAGTEDPPTEIVQTAPDPSPTPRASQIRVTIFGTTLHLTLLGAVIILVMGLLLLTAIILALFPRLRARQTQAANLKLREEIAERERAKASHRESEERLRAVVDTALDGVIAMDHEGRIVDFNPSAERIFNYRKSEVVGQLLAEKIIPIASRELHRRGLEHFLATGEGPVLGKRLELTAMRSDGTEFPVELSITRVGLAEPPLFTGFIRDITERKASEKVLRESGERYRLLFENNPVPMWVYDRSTLRFLEVNDAAVRQYGYLRDEFLSMTIKDIRPPEDVPKLMEEISKAASVFGDTKIWRHRKKDGTAIDVEIATHSFEFKGTPARLVLASNVTERLRAEAALHEADKRAIQDYERLLDRVSSLALVLGTARDLKTVYSALCSFAALSVPLNGLFISLFEPERDVRIAAYAWSEGVEVDVSALPPMEMNASPNSRAVSTGKVIITDDFQSATKGQPVVNIGLDIDPKLPQSSLAVPMSVMGKIVGSIEVQSTEPKAYNTGHATAMQMAANLAANAIENVRLLESERAQAEQLRQSQKMEAIGMLAGGIAHDFNNLLTAITGYSALALRRLPADDSVRPNVEEILKAGDRATALTRQLLAFSRKQVLQPKVLDLNAVVSDMEKMLRRLIGEHIAFRTVLDPKLGNTKADPGQIEQIIVNLVVNARDAMPKGGKLTIETRNVYLDEDYARMHIAVVPGPFVLLGVSDTGIGMDEQTRQRIFEPFFSTKGPGEGTGLGLSTTYGIVKQSGGNIWVYSVPGRGTTLKIYLPRVEEHPHYVGVSTASEETLYGTETILLTEDEEIVRNLAREVLEMYGYRVLTADSGEEALSICESSKEQIHLLVTDVIMPGMSGRELADQMAIRCPEIKVLYMSGYTDSAIVHQGVLDEGANFIQKPFQTDALARKIKEVLDVPAND